MDHLKEGDGGIEKEDFCTRGRSELELDSCVLMITVETSFWVAKG